MNDGTILARMSAQRRAVGANVDSWAAFPLKLDTGNVVDHELYGLEIPNTLGRFTELELDTFRPVP